MRLILALVIFTSCQLCAQGNADRITGKWLKLPKEDMIIEVYKSGHDYQGRIEWLKTPDEKRPVGFVIIDRLKYDSAANKWKNGRIRAAGSERAYDGVARVKPDGTLEVTGYAGMGLFSKTRLFKRIE